MSLLNALLRVLFDAALAPFRGLHPLVGLTVVSLLVSIGMLLVFKRTSAQDQLAAVKRRIHAGLFEIRLFNDDMLATALTDITDDLARRRLRVGAPAIAWLVGHMLHHRNQIAAAIE